MGPKSVTILPASSSSAPPLSEFSAVWCFNLNTHGFHETFFLLRCTTYGSNLLDIFITDFAGYLVVPQVLITVQ